VLQNYPPVLTGASMDHVDETALLTSDACLQRALIPGIDLSLVASTTANFELPLRLQKPFSTAIVSLNR
jgi:hypothetical protein